MHIKQGHGLTRAIKAVGYSLAGFRAAFRSEAAFREELVLVAVGIAAAFYFHVSGLERAVMIGSLLLVLIVEIINTAVETTIERISPEIHSLSKKAKDLGSAAVFLSLINVAAVWALILLG